MFDVHFDLYLVFHSTKMLVNFFSALILCLWFTITHIPSHINGRKSPGTIHLIIVEWLNEAFRIVKAHIRAQCSRLEFCRRFSFKMSFVSIFVFRIQNSETSRVSDLFQVVTHMFHRLFSTQMFPLFSHEIFVNSECVYKRYIGIAADSLICQWSC